jgi:hypothetical protein
MTPKQADAAFESLRRHASAITRPTAPADAVSLLDRAVLTKLQRDAIVHYISVGPDNLALAYSVLKSGAAILAAAGFVADGAEDPPAAPAAGDQSAEREAFAGRLIALSEALTDADPRERATRLLDTFTDHVSVGRERLDHRAGVEDPRRVGDLLEAAGIAYVLAQLLESPPRPVAAAAGR